MEIVTKFECLLSNAEVMAMIRENHDKLEAGTATGRPEEATEMEDRIHEYLSGLPSKLVETGHIETLFKKLRGFTPTEGQPGFKPTELLNIANLRPTSLVELYAILDHAEARFGDEKLEKILSIVMEELPTEDPADDTAAGE